MDVLASRFLDVTLDKNFNSIGGLDGAEDMSLDDCLAHWRACDGELLSRSLITPEDSLSEHDVDMALMCAHLSAEEIGADPRLTAQEMAAINLYTQESPIYHILNRRLRAESRPILKPAFPYLKLLLTAIYSIEPTTATLYRGIGKDLSAGMTVGSKHLWWAFSSATTKLSVVQGFLGTRALAGGPLAQGTLIHIAVTVAYNISKYSAIKGEQEVLLPPGSLCVVEDTFSPAPGLIQVQMKQMPYKPLLKVKARAGGGGGGGGGAAAAVVGGGGSGGGASARGGDAAVSGAAPPSPSAASGIMPMPHIPTFSPSSVPVKLPPAATLSASNSKPEEASTPKLFGFTAAVATVSSGGAAAAGGGAPFGGDVKFDVGAIRRSVADLDGHTDEIRSVAITPDESFILTASDDNRIIVYRVGGSFERVTVLTGHTNWVFSLAASPDGRYVASGGRDNIVRVWAVGSWKCLQTLTEHRNSVYTVAFSPDSNYLVSGGEILCTRMVKNGVWKATTTVDLGGDISSHLLSVAVSPDNQLIASGGKDNMVRVWRIGSSQSLAQLQGHSAGVSGVAFSPDGLYLVSGGKDSSVRVWSARSGWQCTARFTASARGDVNGLTVSPCSRYIISVGDDWIVHLWSIGTGTNVADLKGHRRVIHSVTASRSGKYIVSGCADMTTKVWCI